MDTGYWDFLFFLCVFLINVFQIIYLIQIECLIYIRLIVIFSYNPFKVCRVWNNIPSFSSDVGNMYLLICFSPAKDHFYDLSKNPNFSFINSIICLFSIHSFPQMPLLFLLSTYFGFNFLFICFLKMGTYINEFKTLLFSDTTI